ncbi:MAG: hypothetical protein WCD38_13645, partial [Candidatus Tumulicola sp.]
MFVKHLGTMLAIVTLSACGGGSGGGAAGGGYGGVPPTAAPQSNVPIKQSVAGSPAFVASTSNRTLYFLDVDTPTGSKCTGGCLNTWIALVPNAGAQAQGDFTVVTRADGTGEQWDYRNHPLYTFAGDSGADQNNGDGIA